MELVLNYLNITTIALISLISLFFFLFRLSKVSHTKNPPTIPGSWPILGHLPLMRNTQTPHKTLASLADRYGPIFTIKLGATHALVLNNWELAKECFTKNDIVVSSRPKPVAAEIMSYNQAFIGWAPYGAYWRQLRKIVTMEILSKHRVELLSHIRVSEVQSSIKELVNTWSHQSQASGQSEPLNDTKSSTNDYVSVELNKWFQQLTLNMVLRMVVGKRCFGEVEERNKEEAAEILENIRDFMRLIGTFTVGDAVPFLRWLDLGGHEKEMKKCAKKFDIMLSKWLEEHREKKGVGSDDKVVGERDFMDAMLLVLNDKPIEMFDADTVIKATTMELIIGGSDTTAGTLTWAMSLLLKNPHVLKKAKEELNTQIGKENCVRESDVNKLVYLDAIIKETLRFYPPAPFSSPREFTEDCTIGGYHIKKGTRLMPNLWKIHRDSRVWSDPLEFKPERFLTTNKDVDLGGQNFELLPFGSGRRRCAGMSLGLHMLHYILANFLHSFDILNLSPESIDLTEVLEFTSTKVTPLEVLVKPCLSPKCYEIM
ncbi:cytochrome P450 family 82 protein [Medicago truncatula]|uniref:Cytochrome P450 family 82 protein n=2 Tax=Medicago truncatula TaxID=3880 RepID=G7KJE1_MEDTR|nr:cytochrome P450 family 82 protein [Medicago truncatula]